MRIAQLFLLPLLALVSSVASAQLRNIPDKAIPARMAVLQYPVVSLNGKPARLAPGARILNQMNTSVIPGSLQGGQYLVRYELDPMGDVIRVWMLTEAELQALGRVPGLSGRSGLDALREDRGFTDASGNQIQSPKY